MKQYFVIDDVMSREGGFSLLETLVALAIMSLTSLILFQSTTSMLSVSEKASDASVRIVDNAIARTTFKKIIGELTPGWPDRETTVFKGTVAGFSGLTATFPSAIEQELTTMSMEFRSRGVNNIDLVLKKLGEPEIILDSFEGDEGTFSYLGQDQLFYPVWPPERLRSQGFDTDESFQEVPELPVAIRMTISGTESRDGVSVLWLATVNGLTKLPYRDETAFEDNGL